MVVPRTRSDVKTSKWNISNATSVGPGLTPGTGPVSTANYNLTVQTGGIIKDFVDPLRTAFYKHRAPWDYGSECSIQKKTVNSSFWKTLPHQTLSGKSGVYFYVGDFEGTRVPTNFFSTQGFSTAPTPDSSAILELQMDGWGTKGVNLAYPSKPALGIAQTIAELKREGLPRVPNLKKWQSDPSAAIGGSYLSYQFGFKPVISDIMSIINYDAQLVDSLEKLRRDANQVYRRRATVVQDITTTQLSNQDLSPSMPTPFSDNNFGGRLGAVKVYETVQTDVWFSGAFQFHIPALFQKVPQLDELRTKMFKAGLEPSPELIWQLTPWSWLADWELSIGSAISNLSRFALDGAVMRYGYVMYRKTVTRRYTNPFWGTLEVTAVNFQRRRANPFGFGVLFKDLSPRQWAILAALGLSRGRSIKNDRP